MIKSKRLAYDGRGNAVAKNEEELSTAVSGNMFYHYSKWLFLVCSSCSWICLSILVSVVNFYESRTVQSLLSL